MKKYRYYAVGERFYYNGVRLRCELEDKPVCDRCFFNEYPHVCAVHDCTVLRRDKKNVVFVKVEEGDKK